MLKGFPRALLCSIILIGKVHAQEVIVAREKKPEPPEANTAAFRTGHSRIHDTSAAQIQVAREEVCSCKTHA